MDVEVVDRSEVSLIPSDDSMFALLRRVICFDLNTGVWRLNVHALESCGKTEFAYKPDVIYYLISLERAGMIFALISAIFVAHTSYFGPPPVLMAICMNVW